MQLLFIWHLQSIHCVLGTGERILSKTDLLSWIPKPHPSTALPQKLISNYKQQQQMAENLFAM